MHKSDKKNSGSGDDVNACVESEVMRNRNVQQRNTPEDRVSLDSDSNIFKEACANLGFEE